MTSRIMRAAVTVAAILGAACGGSATSAEPGAAAGTATAQINGAGATFPNPIYSKWFAEYNRRHPGIRINYQPIGSGGGIRQLTNQTVFFGATDGPMTDAQLAAAPGPILHLPTVLGAVVPVYNVEGITDLKFNGAVLADIYLGKIRRWNDPALAALNPGVTLPATDIAAVHRSDGSGTTYIFVDYLSKVSPEFAKRVGVNTSVDWPSGVGAKGNDGVAGLVMQTPGAIGYVELIYALQTGIPFGAVQNAAGDFVKASADSVTRAAAAAPIPADFRVSITNPPGAGAYPISSFTWLLLYERPADAAQARAMVDFVRWAVTDGQTFATELGYAPLPSNVVAAELEALQAITVP
jgi:phosphate transport system substrate-binding protein